MSVDDKSRIGQTCFFLGGGGGGGGGVERRGERRGVERRYQSSNLHTGQNYTEKKSKQTNASISIAATARHYSVIHHLEYT